MRHRTLRIRRAALTLAVGVGTVGGVLAGVGGTAGAVTGSLASGSSVSSTSNPTLQPNQASQATSSVVLTLAAGTSVGTGDTIDLTVSAAGGGSVQWTGTPTVTVGSTGPVASATATIGGTDDTVLTLALTPTAGGSPSTVSQQITVSTLEVNTGSATTGFTSPTAASGAVEASTVYVPSGGTATAFSGSPVTVGTIPPPPTAFVLAATSMPTVGQGMSAQPAGNWTLTLSGTTVGQSWTSGDMVAISVGPNGTTTTQCSGSGYVVFSGTPTLTVTSSSGVSAVPTVQASLAYDNGCNSLEPNVLEVVFTNSGSLTTSSGNAVITISGITYTTGSGAAIGPVAVAAVYETSSGSPVNTVTTTNAPNATVSTTVVTANSPAVSVPGGSVNAPISPISIAESSAGVVGDGYVCLTLTGTGTAAYSATTDVTSTTPALSYQDAFDPASTPKVTVTSGPGTVGTSGAQFETVGSNGTTDNTVVFQVTTSLPESAASTYQVSNLGVDVGNGAAGAVSVLVSTGVSAATACPSSSSTSVTAYTVTTPSNRIYGSDAPGTAAAELAATFPYSGGNGCPGTGGASLAGGVTENRPVVLATDSNYPDALAGAYLASALGTGELLTGINTLPSSTLQALRLEGISQVYVVGGPYVVSNAVVTQLQNTAVYTCGGVNPVTTLLGTAQDITVTRIYGQTEYDTAADIANFPGAAHVGKAMFTGAYAGTNSAGGNGMYNDTSGTASTSATSSVAVPTAILATGQGFQDAESASVLSYTADLPILLTTPGSLSVQAKDELQSLGIQQVIVMGGPIAISNVVVTSLQGMGLSVLRIAGTDFTDTAVQLAKFEMNTATGGLGLGWAPHGSLYVARGDFYTDGLAGAAVAATGSTNAASTCTPGSGTTSATSCSPGHQVPLLLTTNPSTVGTALTGFLNQAGSAAGIDGLGSAYQVSTLNILGGPLAVQNSTVTAMNGDLAAG